MRLSAATLGLGHHGDQSEALYFLVRGRVELRFPREGGHVIVEQVEPGNLLGDQSFLTARPRPAAAHVVDDASLFRLSREAWAEMRRFADTAGGSSQHRPDAPGEPA